MLARAAILSTGDELTTGRIVDTNANWLADKLFEIGIDVTAVLTVGDYPERLEWAWRQAVAQADLVISTGGIGPTADDLTNETVARVAGVPLVLHEESAERIRSFFAAAKRPMPENNLRQAMIPRGAVIIPNALGTAPGYRLAIGQTQLVVLPGVPREMKPMMDYTVLPWIRAQRGGQVYLARVFQTFGITESGLDELIAGVVSPDEGRISFRASFPEVSVRVVVHGEPGEAARRLEQVAGRLRARLGPCVYGEGAVTMQEMVGRALGEKKLTVALAESCTGGLVGHRLTEVPGSSAWFRGGVVVYANDLKQRLIGVRAETLERHGAVSEETAREMALGALGRSRGTLALAVTGIAGPGGGTPGKPVGTVCFAWASRGGSLASETRRFAGDREAVRRQSVERALAGAAEHLDGA